jgi:hypothetical protein
MVRDAPPPPDLPDGALPLSEAISRFTPPDLWSEYQRKAAQRRELPRRPAFHYEADNRIANAATTVQADLGRLLRRLKKALVSRMIEGELVAYAQTDAPFGPWRAIPAGSWRNLRITDIRRGQVLGPNVDMVGLHVLEAAKNITPVVRTGMQGRPKKGAHFIMAEFERRLAAKQIMPSRRGEAEWLLAWFLANHPDKEPPTAKTIYNKLPSRVFVPASK